MVTVAEEILARASGMEEVKPGDIINANVDYAMSHDNAALVIKKFKQIGKERVWDNGKIVIILDHRTPANTIKTAEGHRSIREFVKEQGIKNFYDINRGICHQVMIEEGFASPGRLIVGTDSHTTSYGAVGAFSTGIGATEMAAVWATGKIWLRVPESYKIVIEGEGKNCQRKNTKSGKDSKRQLSSQMGRWHETLRFYRIHVGAGEVKEKTSKMQY